MYKDLREWLAQVERLGQLKRVSGASWDLEMGALTQLAHEEFEEKTPPHSVRTSGKCFGPEVFHRVWDLKSTIVACCRVLFAEGHADMNLGHVSAREPGARSIWLKPGGLGLEETTVESLVELDVEGKKLSGDRNPPGEWPLHTEIFRARPDVNCVIHTHPLWTVVFGIVGLPFQVVNQDGVVIEHGLRFYNGTAELVTTKEQGKQLAADLSDGTAILMRNHGVTLVASSAEECLLLALNLEKALQAQLLAEMCGGARHRIDPAVAVQMGQKLLSSQKRTQDLFAYNVRKAERILAFMERSR